MVKGKNPQTHEARKEYGFRNMTQSKTWTCNLFDMLNLFLNSHRFECFYQACYFSFVPLLSWSLLSDSCFVLWVSSCSLFSSMQTYVCVCVWLWKHLQLKTKKRSRKEFPGAHFVVVRNISTNTVKAETWKTHRSYFWRGRIWRMYQMLK